MPSKDVIRKREAVIATQLLHVGPVSARSNSVEELGRFSDKAAKRPFEGLQEKLCCFAMSIFLSSTSFTSKIATEPTRTTEQANQIFGR